MYCLALLQLRPPHLDMEPESAGDTGSTRTTENSGHPEALGDVLDTLVLLDVKLHYGKTHSDFISGATMYALLNQLRWTQP